jgi:hypothetical protein
MVFEAIPFPFDTLVFMLPKRTVRHPTDGDCPFLVLSRTTKGQNLSLPIPGLEFSGYRRLRRRACDHLHAGSGIQCHLL